MDRSHSPDLWKLAKEFVTTEGRASRGMFWFAMVGAFFVMGALGAIGELLPEAGKLVLGGLAIPILFVVLVVQVKRWHDLDKSGWWVLIGFLPCVGVIWVLVECGLMPGTAGPNRFGPDPTQPPQLGNAPRG